MVNFRPLSQSNTPIRGPISPAQPVILVAQQGDGIYVLCLFTYGSHKSGDLAYELIFSPCSNGNYNPYNGSDTVDNASSVFVGAVFDNTTSAYADVLTMNAVVTPFYEGTDDTDKDNYYKVDNVSVAMLLPGPDGTTFSVLDSSGLNLGNLVTTRKTGPKFPYMYTTIGDDTSTPGTVYSVTTSNTYFNFPNIYAGETYTFNYVSISPFRFLNQQTGIQVFDGDSYDYVLSPSVCSKQELAESTNTDLKNYSGFPYQCNSNYDNISGSNLLRFGALWLHYPKDSPTYDAIVAYATTDISSGPQTAETQYNFFPASFYPSNVSYVAGSINTGGPTCSLVTNSDPDILYDPTFFITQVFYFWASGFDSYSNNNSSNRPNFVTSVNEGFVARTTPPPNSAAWTTLDECGRSYFYKLCEPVNNTPTYCGTCLGQCSTGQICAPNPNFNATSASGNPFVCGLPPTPPVPNEAKTFWEKYKKEIIIFIVVVLVVAIIFLLLVFIKPKSSSKNNSSKSQREIYVG